MLQVYPVPGWTGCILAQDPGSVVVRLQGLSRSAAGELFPRYSFPLLTAVLGRLACRVTGRGTCVRMGQITRGLWLLPPCKEKCWVSTHQCWEGGGGSAGNGQFSHSDLVNSDVFFLHEKEDNLTGTQFTDLSSLPLGAPVSPLLRAQRRDTVPFRALCKSLALFWL